jgi:hypothetical protein
MFLQGRGEAWPPLEGPPWSFIYKGIWGLGVTYPDFRADTDSIGPISYIQGRFPGRGAVVGRGW